MTLGDGRRYTKAIYDNAIIRGHRTRVLRGEGGKDMAAAAIKREVAISVRSLAEY